MPRPELLSTAQREALMAPPSDISECIRYYTLSADDLHLVRQHRGIHNQLGFAVQLCYLRFPGRTLGVEEVPSAEIVGFVAAQLGLPASAWLEYAKRDQTRREHLQELQRHSGLRLLTVADYRDLAGWVTTLAMQTSKGIVLVQEVIEEMRQRRLLLPPITVIERMCAEAATRARRRIYRTLTRPLTEQQGSDIDSLLEATPSGKASKLAWLRQPAGAPSPLNLLGLIERLNVIREIKLPTEIGQAIHQNRLLQLAREGAQSDAPHLRQLEPMRRRATLVIILLEIAATLTDEILDMHDRMIGSLFARAKRIYETSFQESGKAINEKIRLYVKVGQALISAKAEGRDPFQAIEQIVPWQKFTQSVSEAEKLARPEDFDYLDLVSDGYAQLRRYAPTFLAAFEFRAAPVAKSLSEAINLLRHLNATNSRRVPDNAPCAFVRRRWSRYIFTDDGLDRRYYELCVLAELKNALRSGDIWVQGSRQFKDFEDYLLSRDRFVAMRAAHELRLAIDTESKSYFAERLDRLHDALTRVDALAAVGQLPDAEINSGGLKVAPLTNDVPQVAEELMRQAYARLPHLKITDLLIEVDHWTGFTRHFTHLKSGEPAKDKVLLLTAILADAINLGLTKMAEACAGATFARLSWLAAWHIRDETYSKALAEILNYQHRLPFAGHWGAGTTSSSDGQRFRAGGRGEAVGQVNLRYGTDPSVLFYTHLSDQYAPYHTKVINATVRDATHVLDGLLYHESDLKIEEHYTDTAGFTDHVFALCHMLGFRFAPRIRDLADKRLYVPGRANAYPTLAGLIGGTIDVRQGVAQWDELLRLASSIKHGTVTASLMLRKLGSYPRQNGLALALREIGRIERTLFMLEWLQNPELRRRVNAGLNKSEAKNALARAVFFNRLGELRDRSFENQRYRASGLNLAVAAIITWNTVYLERAVASLSEQKTEIQPELFAHISPLGWEHIGLTGDYSWHENKRVAQGRFRPLRIPSKTNLWP